MMPVTGRDLGHGWRRRDASDEARAYRLMLDMIPLWLSDASSSVDLDLITGHRSILAVEGHPPPPPIREEFPPPEDIR